MKNNAEQAKTEYQAERITVITEMAFPDNFNKLKLFIIQEHFTERIISSVNCLIKNRAKY